MKLAQGYIYASLSALLWASTPSVSKLLLIRLDNIQILFFSTLFASLILLVISTAQGKLTIIKTYTYKDYVIFAFMGFIGVFLYRFFLQAAYLKMPAQEAFIINYTWPIMVVLFSVLLLKEKLTFVKILALLVSFLGVIIVVTKGDFSVVHFSPAGTILALAAAMASGLYSTLGKKQIYEKFTSMTFFYLFSFVFSAISLLSFSFLPSLSLAQLGGLLWLGIFPSGLGFVFWLLALKYGDTAKVSNFIFITPCLALIYNYFLIGEEIFLSSIVGLGIIIFGILLQSIKVKN